MWRTRQAEGKQIPNWIDWTKCAGASPSLAILQRGRPPGGIESKQIDLQHDKGTHQVQSGKKKKIQAYITSLMFSQENK